MTRNRTYFLYTGGPNEDSAHPLPPITNQRSGVETTIGVVLLGGAALFLVFHIIVAVWSGAVIRAIEPLTR
jgi:hypothetical protein